MHKGFLMVSVSAGLMLLLASCPSTPSPLVGTWTAMVDANTIGLELNADGSATAFPMPNTLDGNLTWEANGTEFILRRAKPNPMGPTVSVLYIGRVANNSEIYGVWIHWEGGPYGSSGYFTAQKQ